MTIEHARVRVLPKPWGRAELQPWYRRPDTEPPESVPLIGELCFERTDNTGSAPSLLLKLLFTSQPLSIQVHPDDVHARALGLPNGKSEAWYVLSACADAQVALGLKQPLTRAQLEAALHDGSIVDAVHWCPVRAGDIIPVPAGTIHAIGAGLVIAEIQQRSDTTFRVWDYGRGRDLHIESALAVAKTDVPQASTLAKSLTFERTLLTANTHFVFERIDLAPLSRRCLDATRETWLLTLNGSALIDTLEVTSGDVIFAQSSQPDLCAGTSGVSALIAYTGSGGPVSQLLQPHARLDSTGRRSAVAASFQFTSLQQSAPPPAALGDLTS